MRKRGMQTARLVFVGAIVGILGFGAHEAFGSLGIRGDDCETWACPPLDDFTCNACCVDQGHDGGDCAGTGCLCF